MKKILFTAALCTAAAFPALAQVGVSVSIGQPGFYGQIDIGDVPHPQVIYAQPVIVQPATVVEQPIYLRVPPGHRKHWKQHCREYNACGRPVYFVRNDWYTNVYAPQYRERHGPHGGEPHGERGPGRGPGPGAGPGHDRGHGPDHDYGHGHGRD